jgi:hypothetical protein
MKTFTKQTEEEHLGKTIEKTVETVETGNVMYELEVRCHPSEPPYRVCTVIRSFDMLIIS